MTRFFCLMMTLALIPLLAHAFQPEDADDINQARAGLVTPLPAQEDLVPTETPIVKDVESTTVPYEEGETDSRGSVVYPYPHQCGVGPHDVYMVKEYDDDGKLEGEFYPIYQVKLAAGDADNDASHDAFLCEQHMKTMYDMIKMFETNGGKF